MTNRSPRLVNDLDITLTEGYTIHYPWILDPAAPDKPAGRGDNIRDNIDQVYLANPVPGRMYTLNVSHKNKLKNGRQPNALIFSGLERPDCNQAALLTPGADTTLYAGSTITHAANAVSGMTYEWLKDGVSVQKGDARTFDIVQAGSYAVRVNSAACSAVSKRVLVRNSDLFATLAQKGDVLVCDAKGIALSANTGTEYRHQ